MDRHERMFRHEHAHVLDDPERQKWLPTAPLLKRLVVGPGMRVADVGAGTGYFALPLARAVAPGGRVFAVDVQPEMLDHLRSRLEPGLPVTLVAGEATRTALDDASVDLVLLVNVWHEIDDRQGALAEMARILAPHGRIAIVDWRPDAPPPPGPHREHRLAPPAVHSELRAGGWKVEPPEPAGLYGYLIVGNRA